MRGEGRERGKKSRVVPVTPVTPEPEKPREQNQTNTFYCCEYRQNPIKTVHFMNAWFEVSRQQLCGHLLPRRLGVADGDGIPGLCRDSGPWMGGIGMKAAHFVSTKEIREA